MIKNKETLEPDFTINKFLKILNVDKSYVYLPKLIYQIIEDIKSYLEVDIHDDAAREILDLLEDSVRSNLLPTDLGYLVPDVKRSIFTLAEPFRAETPWSVLVSTDS